jgi:pyruvate dehydrogenase E2 component (dihydrolipoamide acetyltransferase)
MPAGEFFTGISLMATKVHMEALSPTMEEGQLVRWLKSEGDTVSNGEILAEIETDKATMELVARGEGILRKILLGEGATALVGEVIGIIAGPDEDIGGLVTSATAAAESPVTVAVEPSAAVAAKAGQEVSGVSVQEVEAIQAVADVSPVAEVEASRVKASPLARRLAAEADLDLHAVPGSGPGGRIVMRDVEAVRGGTVSVPAAVLETATSLRPEKAPGVDFEDVPLSQMRKTIAKRLVESLGPVPHFFLRISVDMSRMLAARKRVNELLQAHGEKTSINDFILKATAAALERHPEANAQWAGDAIRRHHRVHLGVAVAVDDGLITPVIRDANRKGLAEIGREVRELASRGKEKKLQPEEYTGSTFSVSNLGMFGIQEFTGVINPPEAGIIAVGGIEEMPVVENGQVVIRPMMTVTMSCDHRVVDGATGAKFLQTLKEMLEEPAAILV